MTPPWHLKRAKQPNELVMLHGLLTKPRNLLSTQTPLPVLPAPPAAPQPALQTMLMRQQPLHPKQLPPQEPVTKPLQKHEQVRHEHAQQPLEHAQPLTKSTESSIRLPS